MPRRRSHDGRRPRRRRVLMLGPTAPLVGGMASAVEGLKHSILAQRCQLTVINNGKTTPPDRGLGVAIAAQVRLLVRIVRQVLRESIDLVHIHTCSGFTFWRDGVHVAAARAVGCQVVWHIHGGYFDQFYASYGPVRKSLLRLILGLGEGIIVVSDEWRQRLESMAPAGRWYSVPNGVPMPQIRARTSGRTARFLFLGNLRPGKGAEDLVRACAIAVSQGFGGVVDLVGPQIVPGRRDALICLIDELGCGSAARLVDTVTGDAKERILRQADVFVLPSHAEGLPVAMLEAMAYGLPVIATRVGGIPAVLRDGVEGFLIEAGDVNALSDRMLRLSQDPNLRQQMGNAAQRRAEAEFSLDCMAERIAAVYDDALGAEGPRR